MRKLKTSPAFLKTKPNKSIVSRCQTSYDPDMAITEADKELAKNRGKFFQPEVGSNIFNALTLHEFQNGMLMTTVIPEQYRTLAISMLRDLQLEFNCQTTNEKATAELAVISYMRSLEAQRRFNNVLSQGAINAFINQFLSIMSKELDRANRHFLTAIQSLKMMHQPPMQVNIKTNTAVVGQNQIVQSNSHE